MNASQFEARLKDFVQKLQAEFGPCNSHPTRGDVVEEILLGILGRDTCESRAREALERLRRSMVDHNEMRVAVAGDVAEEIGPGFPGIDRKAQDVVAVLSQIYERLETLDLTEFRARPKREAQKFLSEIQGLDAYTLGRVMLLCFGAHAVPITEPALAWMQHQGLFAPSVEVSEAQGVLERHVRSSDAMKVFCLLQRLAEKAPPAPPRTPAPDKKKVRPPARPAASGKPGGKGTNGKSRTAAGARATQAKPSRASAAKQVTRKAGPKAIARTPAKGPRPARKTKAQ